MKKLIVIILLIGIVFSCRPNKGKNATAQENKVRIITERDSSKFNLITKNYRSNEFSIMATIHDSVSNANATPKENGIFLNDLVGLVLVSIVNANKLPDTSQYLRVKTIKLNVSSTITNDIKGGIENDYLTFTDDKSTENSRVNNYTLSPDKFVQSSIVAENDSNYVRNKRLLNKVKDVLKSLQIKCNDLQSNPKRYNGDDEDGVLTVEYQKALADRQKARDQITQLQGQIFVYENAKSFQGSLVQAAQIGMKAYKELRNSYGNAIAGCYSVQYGLKLTTSTDGKFQIKIFGITPSLDLSKTDAEQHSIELDFGDPNQCK